VREVTRAKLWEISAVTWGANPEARITEAHRRGEADPEEAQLDAEEARLRAVELALAEDTLRDAELSALTAEQDRIARSLGLDPAAPLPPPDPTSVLGVALAVHEREQRERAEGRRTRDLNAAIYRESGQRRRRC
jgi:hypothetical protein